MEDMNTIPDGITNDHCPFCGHTAKAEQLGKEDWVIWCEGCGASTAHYRTEDMAWKYWIGRVGTSEEREILRQLNRKISDQKFEITSMRQLLKQSRAALDNSVSFIGWLPVDPDAIKNPMYETIAAIDQALGEKYDKTP